MRDAVTRFELDEGLTPAVGHRAPMPVWRRVSLRQQMLFGFMVPLLIVLLASVSLVQALDALAIRQAASAESNEATALRYRLLNLVLESEAALRGYLLSGNPVVLRPYHSAWQQLPLLYARLEVTEAPEPAHMAKLRDTRALFQRWRQEFADPQIALRRATPVGMGDDLRRLAGLARPSLPDGAARGLQATVLERLQDQLRQLPPGWRADELSAILPAVRAYRPDTPRLLALAEHVQVDERRLSTMVENRRGEQLTDRIGRLMQASLQDEWIEQRGNAAAAVREARRARWIAILAPSTALVIGLSLILLLVFDAIRAIAAATKAAVAVAHGNLDKRLRVRRRDELGALASAFNLMADELADRRRRNAALDSFQTLLVTSNTTDEINEAVIRMSEVMFPGWAGALYKIAASHDLARQVAQWGWPEGANSPQWHPHQCRALRAALPYFAAANTVEIPCPHTDGMGLPVTASFCLPLSAQGDILGILQLCHFGDATGPALTLQQRETAAVMVEQLSMSLANLQLREKLRNQSIRDPLTGLFNRRFLEETMSRELAHATRTGQPLVVAVIDVDHFKRFNDRFGHEAGDLVLVELADVFRQFVRSTDIVCRYGGEEFVLLMPDNPLPVAVERAETLRAKVAELQVRLGSGQLQSIHISVGVAQWSGPGEPAEVLLRHADTALYAAKNGGRNRVEAFTPTHPE